MTIDPPRQRSRCVRACIHGKPLAVLACWLCLLVQPLHAQYPETTPGGILETTSPVLEGTGRWHHPPGQPLPVAQVVGFVAPETAGPDQPQGPPLALVRIVGFTQQAGQPEVAQPLPPTPPQRPLPPGQEPLPEEPLPDDPSLPSPEADQFDLDPDDLEPTPSFFGDELYSRLENAPWMFGDAFLPAGQLIAIEASEGVVLTATTDLPLMGGSRAVKVSEQNKALPQDRIYFPYQHFSNALSAEVDDVFQGFASQDSAVDRYTFAIEKTFLDELWSYELRVPLTGRFSFNAPDFSVAGGKGGDVALILKRLIYRSSTASAVVGLGVTLPTGSGARGEVNFSPYAVQNDSTNLLPYIGVLSTPDRLFFYQAFAQLDISTGGNRVELDGAPIGILDEQTLIYLDVESGYWLIRQTPSRYSSALTGLASVLELHYTTTLQNADSVAAQSGFTSFDFGNFGNRLDILNLTVGLHAEFGYRTSFRVGGVFPLREGDDRQFDTEVQASLIQRF